MSTDSSKPANPVEPEKVPHKSAKNSAVPWGPIEAIVLVVFVYLAAQYVAIWLTSFYPLVHHWSHERATSWLTNSILAQFIFIVLAEAITIIALFSFIRYRKGNLKSIGLVRPKLLEDASLAVTGLFVYLPLYIVAVIILSGIFHGLNVSQQQDIGFTKATTIWQLLAAFVSLVILPPVAEEITFRGFLYSGLRKKLTIRWAIVVTSLVFAAPHLLEAQSGGALWIAGIDTFVLSLVLCYLRERTKRLYAGMGLHALKNFIAYFMLFISPHIHLFTKV